VSNSQKIGKSPLTFKMSKLYVPHHPSSPSFHLSLTKVTQGFSKLLNTPTLKFPSIKRGAGVCQCLSLRAAFGGEAIYSSFCHSRLERACPTLDAGEIQFPYLNPSPGIYHPTVTLAKPENLLFPVILSRRRRICLS